MGTLRIPISKAAKAIEVDTDLLPENVYAAALAEGLKVLLNAKMSKIAIKGLEGEHLAKAHEAAFAKAEENLSALMAGKVKEARSTSVKDSDGAKVPGPVMVEARRIARNVVKDAIRAKGMKISHVEAKDITAAANELIASDPSYIEQAKANLEARAVKPIPVDIASLVSESPKLKAAADKRKAEAKDSRVLSAKQAGKTAPHVPSKGAVPPASATQH